MSYLLKFAHRATFGVNDEAPVLTHQRDLLVSDLPKEVDRSPRWKIQRELELIRRHLRLQRPPQRVLRSEEAVRGHHAVDSLVRPEVIVVGEVVA